MPLQARTAFVAATLVAVIVSASSAGGSSDPRPGPSPGVPCESTLVRAGDVTWKLYDTVGRSDLGGTTDFHFDDAFDYTYSWRVVEATVGRRLVILPHVRASVRLRHTVHLPGGIADTTGWWRRLRRHELDHVAISTDERPRLLFTYLVARLDSVTVPLAANAVVTPGLIRESIGHVIGERHGPVVALLQANYDLLDSLTMHGVVALPDRAAFFRSLYERPRLEAHGFRWLDAVAPILESGRYRNAPRPRCD
jgi:hypothetical protein